jgi:hypothetical protein
MRNGGYKQLNRKDRAKTLRERGLNWAGGQPLWKLTPKWLQHVTDPSWLTTKRWVDEANLLTDQEMSVETPSVELLKKLPEEENFSIRRYQMVTPETLFPLLQRVRRALQSVVAEPRAKGIDHVEPDPFTLFMFALATADPKLLRKCSVCGKLLYVKRRDQVACSGECSNTARQRRSRDRLYYNANRKQNQRATEDRDRRKKAEILSRLKRKPK